MSSMLEQAKDSYLFGSNADFIEEIYEKYLVDPQEVDEKWHSYFDSIQSGISDVSHDVIRKKFALILNNSNKVINAPTAVNINLDNAQVNVWKLVEAYRYQGYKYANLDPLAKYSKTPAANKFDTSIFHLNTSGDETYTVDYNSVTKHKVIDIIEQFNQIYCGSIGFDYAHVSNLDERKWLVDYAENNYLNFKLSQEQHLNTLHKLAQAEGFDKYLHSQFTGQKRFSIEGAESLIPLLENLITKSSKLGVKEIYLGMAHRGRLSTLVNLFGKKPQDLFNEFNGDYTLQEFVTSGDVKYHKGYKCNYSTADGAKVKLTLAYNPSHLEAVNPVINGMVKAAGDSLANIKEVMGVLIHGDSALIGLGTNQGVLSMSQTRAYGVGGLIHVIVNNQIGFTNSNLTDNRSSLFSSDIMKMIESPVIHVNADDLTSVLFAIEMAIDYKAYFAKDILIDLVCFRRYGHNEADDPTFTQPIMYAKIKSHPGTFKLYSDELIAQGLVTSDQVKQIVQDYRASLAKGEHPNALQMQSIKWYDDFDIEPVLKANSNDRVDTTVSLDKLGELTDKISMIPDGFVAHSMVNKLITTRLAMGHGKQNIDFGMAEMLAYASLLDSGINVRITGEDSGRGTFSHRHAVWHNTASNFDDSNSMYISLNNVLNHSQVNIYDSILNEECVLGFEYGYSTKRLNDLVIWEAQFGDFANGAQVMIDQFIATGENKWGVLSNLTLLLPHGYDGQGPEHSSARLERFLQLCAQNNMQVVQPTTAAQIFHLLRYKALTKWKKPLVILLSKKLLRYKNAMSPIVDFTNGGFLPIIKDMNNSYDLVKRVILCSGQVYYELTKALAEKDANYTSKIAIIRLEQLYPFPAGSIGLELAKYKVADDFVWVQDEPYNQGAWIQIREALDSLIASKNKHFRAISRMSAAAPATGVSTQHVSEAAYIIAQALK